MSERIGINGHTIDGTAPPPSEEEEVSVWADEAEKLSRMICEEADAQRRCHICCGNEAMPEQKAHIARLNTESMRAQIMYCETSGLSSFLGITDALIVCTKIRAGL